MLKSNLNLKLVGIILGILIIGTIYLVSQEYLSLQNEINSLSLIKATGIEKVREKTLYIIDFGNGNVKSYQIIPSENLTVFSLLEELAKRENFKIEFTIYEGMGVLVENIDGARNGTDNKYWQYWLNGELPTIAADKKEIKEGDRVEWKFAPSLF